MTRFHQRVRILPGRQDDSEAVLPARRRQIREEARHHHHQASTVEVGRGLRQSRHSQRNHRQAGLSFQDNKDNGPVLWDKGNDRRDNIGPADQKSRANT